MHKDKLRMKVKGNTLYDKYKTLYYENPNYSMSDYMNLLDITKTQCYGFKSKLKKELESSKNDINVLKELTAENTNEEWEHPFELSVVDKEDDIKLEKISPVFDINISGVDGITIQNFLRILLSPEKTNSNKKYTLELKLTEH